MGKLAVLKIGDGDFGSGFQVTLRIGEDGVFTSTEISGWLPPAPRIVKHYEAWQLTYRTRSISSYRHLDPIKGQQTNFSVLDEAAQLQSSINEWLNSGYGQFRPIRDRLLETLGQKNDDIRFIIQADDIWLWRLPWHLWDIFERYSHVEVALSTTEFEQVENSSVKTPQSQVRILVILGDSSDINVQQDLDLIEQQLPDADIFPLTNPQRDQLSDELWEKDWDILFFAGHSSSQEGKSRIYINQTESLTIAELKYALKRAIARGLKLAIFNSCDGLGLARYLADLQIPAVIVMRERVPDRVAQKFLEYFLKAFAKQGKSLYVSVREARERLHALENQFPCASWLPAICQNPASVPPTWQELRARAERDSSLGRATDSYPSRIPTAKVDDGRSRPRKILLTWRRLRVVLLASVVITTLLMGSRWQGKLQTWELQAFDHLMQLRPVAGPDRQLLVVRVTAADIQAQPPEERGGGAASLSDRTLDQLLKKLESHQPQVIGLDIYREGSVSPVYPDLAASLRRNDRLISICEGSSPNINDSGISAPPEVPQNRIGFSDFVLDEDDVIRRHLLLMELDPPYTCKAKEVEAFSLKLALSYLKQKGLARQDGPQDEFLQIGGVVFQPLQLHTGGYHRSDLDKHGNLITDMRGYQVMLNHRPYRNYLEDIAPTVTLKAVLNNQLTSEDVRNRIVLIGVDDNERDQHYTPYTSGHQPPQKVPGVFIHAQMVSQILNAVLERQRLFWAWPWWGDATWVWGWSLVGGVLAVRVRSLLLLVLAGGVALSILYGLCFGFLTLCGWIPLVPSALALLATGISVAAHNIFQARRR